VTTAVRLKHLARIAISNVDKKTADGQEAVRLCNYTDVYYNDRITADCAFMEATASAEQLRDFRLAPGDVLITKDSETPDDIAVPALVESSAPDVVCGYHLAIIRPNHDLIEPRFLFWSLASTSARGWFGAQATGVTRFGLRVQSISDAQIRVPPLREQREIADFLDAETARIDALIEKKQRMVALLEERRTVLTAARVMNPTWPRVKLTLLARLGSGHTPSRSRSEWWEDPTIPWITTGDIHQMRGDRIEYIESTRFSISEVGLANSAAELHPAETVVLSRTASVGFSAITARPMATSQDFATWTCGPRLRPRFLLLCLRAMRSELLGRLATGSTHKTIYMPDIESIRVPLPSLEEQDRAVSDVWARLRPIDRAVDAIDRQVALLRERRQALITAAVTGQLDVSRAAA
jgi:type I restriction enzyme S subunit